MSTDHPNNAPAEEGKNYRPKIYRFDAKGKVMDVQDMIFQELDRSGTLSEGKLIFNFCEYDQETKKAKQTFKHYMDVDTARRLFYDILNMRIRKDPDPEKQGRYLPLVEKEEFKGGRHNGNEGWEFESRRMRVVYNDQLNIGPVFQFAFLLGEGRPTDTRAVLPKGQPKYTGQINISVDAARAGAATILDYINNLQTAQMVRSLMEDAQGKTIADMSEKIDALGKLVSRTLRLQQAA